MFVMNRIRKTYLRPQLKPPTLSEKTHKPKNLKTWKTKDDGTEMDKLYTNIKTRVTRHQTSIYLTTGGQYKHEYPNLVIVLKSSPVFVRSGESVVFRFIKLTPSYPQLACPALFDNPIMSRLPCPLRSTLLYARREASCIFHPDSLPTRIMFALQRPP